MQDHQEHSPASNINADVEDGTEKVLSNDSYLSLSLFFALSAISAVLTIANFFAMAQILCPVTVHALLLSSSLLAILSLGSRRFAEMSKCLGNTGDFKKIIGVWLVLALCASKKSLWDFRPLYNLGRNQKIMLGQFKVPAIENAFDISREELVKPQARSRRFAFIGEAPRGGAFGRVFRVQDRFGEGREFALKYGRTAASSFCKYRMHREAFIHQRLRDIPGVVNLRNVAFARGNSQMFLLMDWVEGVPLTKLHQEQKDFPEWPLKVQLIMYRLVSILQMVHARGVIHGDLNTSNILITDPASLQLVLIDFGMSRLERGRQIDGIAGVEKDYLKVSQFPDNPLMAPEVRLLAQPKVIRDELKGVMDLRLTSAADVWSVAVLMIALLVKVPRAQPVDAKKMIEEADLAALVKEIITENCKLGLEDGAADFILQILKIDPAKRPTANQLLSHPYLFIDSHHAITLS